jgi:hypothetical protein
MHKTIILSLSVLLAACATGGGYSGAEPSVNSGHQQPSCPVGGTCQNLGGDTFTEEERLNSGLKAENDAALEAEADKIRAKSAKNQEKEIKRLEQSTAN